MNGKVAIVFAVLCFLWLRIVAEEDLVFYWKKPEMPKCDPFTTFSYDCNKCVCGADKIPYCTKMACSKSYMSMKKSRILKRMELLKKLRKEIDNKSDSI